VAAGLLFGLTGSRYPAAPVAIVTEAVRREWEEGYRRFEAALREPVAGERLQRQLEVVTDELRRRIGQTFTLDELAAAYDRADSWVRQAVSEHAATHGWPRSLALVEDAAFHLYQRGAVDYRP
jgi:alcohol dehydrogenase class IV